MKLKTDRLLLREINKSDAKSLIENINDLKISRWLILVPYPYKLKDANWFINKCVGDSKKKNRESYDLAIELNEDKKLIGVIGLSVKTSQNTATIGYWLGSKYHRKGYGTEALSKIIDLAFKQLKLRRLEARVLTGNPSSSKLLEKFNFKYEGTLRQASKSKADGKVYDDLVYGLLKSDWEKK